MSTNKTRWGIVGGGILGMTLALRLADQGEMVAIFEKKDHLGGLADAWSLGDIVWDRYYHVILPDDFAILGLFSELGLEEKVRWVKSKSGFFHEDRWLSMSGLAEFFRFPVLSIVERFWLAASIFYGARMADREKLKEIPAVDWLKKISGEEPAENGISVSVRAVV